MSSFCDVACCHNLLTCSPNSSRPGGAAAIRRNFFMAFAHPGHHPVSIADGFQLAGQASLRRFVAFIDDLIDRNNLIPLLRSNGYSAAFLGLPSIYVTEEICQMVVS